MASIDRGTVLTENTRVIPAQAVIAAYSHAFEKGTTLLVVRPTPTPPVFPTWSHAGDKGRTLPKFSVNALEAIVAAPVPQKMYWH